jgi:polar amino acid transport system substrate-binding protein
VALTGETDGSLNADLQGDPIDIQTFPDNPAAVQELSLGRVAAELADDPVAAYSAAQSDGDLELAATGFESATYGIGVRKDSTALNTAISAALTAIVGNGKYLQILQDWGQEEFRLQD